MIPLARLLVAHHLPAICFSIECLFLRTKGFLKAERAIDRSNLFTKLSEQDVHATIIDDQLDKKGIPALIHKIRLEYSKCKIIILASSLCPEYIKELMKLKADGYIYAALDEKEIKKGIIKVVEGNKHLCSEITAVITSGAAPVLPDENTIEKILGLTPMEKEIYVLTAKQKKHSEIADATGKSLYTVKQQSSYVFQKVQKAGFNNVIECFVKTGYLPEVEIKKRE
jgi:DNA-binding NarL/FixJ family response regulator